MKTHANNKEELNEDLVNITITHEIIEVLSL